MIFNGRYMCRFAGCKSTLVHDGQRRRNHELKHNPPVVIPDDGKQCDAYFEEKPEEVDDMFNYQKALLEYGMVLANLQDAISEGSCHIHYKYFLSILIFFINYQYFHR